MRCSLACGVTSWTPAGSSGRRRSRTGCSAAPGASLRSIRLSLPTAPKAHCAEPRSITASGWRGRRAGHATGDPQPDRPAALAHDQRRPGVGGGRGVGQEDRHRARTRPTAGIGRPPATSAGVTCAAAKMSSATSGSGSRALRCRRAASRPSGAVRRFRIEVEFEHRAGHGDAVDGGDDVQQAFVQQSLRRRGSARRRRR